MLKCELMKDGKCVCSKPCAKLIYYLKGYTDALQEQKQDNQEIYKCQFYCMADYCRHKEPSADMCVDCLYESVTNSIDRKLKELKEQKSTI